MKDKAKELKDKFPYFSMEYDKKLNMVSYSKCDKQCALIAIDFAEQELASHGVKRKDYYNDLRKQL